MIRNTKQRELILKQLEVNPQPQSAEMILTGLKHEKINLATIYRALNMFQTNGIVFKSVVNQTSYYTLAKHGHHHYLICLSCNKMEEIECDINETEEITNKHHFHIAYHDMTYFGYCEDCVKKQKRE